MATKPPTSFYNSHYASIPPISDQFLGLGSPNFASELGPWGWRGLRRETSSFRTSWSQMGSRTFFSESSIFQRLGLMSQFNITQQKWEYFFFQQIFVLVMSKIPKSRDINPNPCILKLFWRVLRYFSNETLGQDQPRNPHSFCGISAANTCPYILISTWLWIRQNLATM